MPPLKNTIQGALLSGLVFPGLGQAVLKHYRRAAILMLAFSALFVAPLAKVLQRAVAVLDSLQWEGGFIDVGTIAGAAARAADPSADRTLRLLLVLLAACWALGVVDAALLGRRKDREACPPGANRRPEEGA